MSYWDRKAKLIIQDGDGIDIAVKNRFPPLESESQSLTTILERIRLGEIQYDSLVITVRGARRPDVPILIAGTDNFVGERRLEH